MSASSAHGTSRPFSGALVAVLVAAASGFVYDALWATSRHPLALSYLALCAGLTLGAALLVGAAGKVIGPAAALGAWAGLAGWLSTGDRWPIGIFFALALAIAAWMLTRTCAAISAGVGVGAAAALALVLWPRMAVRLGLPRAETPIGLAITAVVFVAALATYALYERERRRRRWRVPAAALVAGGVAIAAAAGLLLPDRSPTIARPASTPAAPASSRPPSVLLVVLDTVRADHLSVYGYERDTTPLLASLLRDTPRAVLYPLAFAPSNWTQPSHVSLLTGTLPSTHGVHTRRAAPGTPPGRHRVVRADETLPERMQGHGYRTGAVLANVLLTEVQGIRRGFDRFVVPPTARPLRLVGEPLRSLLAPHLAARAILPYPPGAVITDGILDFIDGADERPFFVLANYMDAHSPYLPVEPHAGRYGNVGRGAPPLEPFYGDSAERLAWASARYDEEIRGLDAEIGRLFHELERRNVLDSIWIVVTSDHGEAFGEHGVVFHASSAHNEQVRIPLLVRPPAGRNVTRVDHAVDLLDVTATLAAVASGETLGTGRDLRGEETLRPVQIEFFGNWKGEGVDRFGPLTYVPTRAVVARTTKLLEYPERRELFELAIDPLERSDLAADEPERVAALVPLLPPLRAATDPTDAGEAPALSEEDLQRLRALGYVD